MAHSRFWGNPVMISMCMFSIGLDASTLSPWLIELLGKLGEFLGRIAMVEEVGLLGVDLEAL